jgi:hypothetical protein
MIDLEWIVKSAILLVCGLIGYFLRDFVKKVDGKVDISVCREIQAREDAVLDGLKKDINNLTGNVDKLTNEFGSKSVMVVESVQALLKEQKKSG